MQRSSYLWPLLSVCSCTGWPAPQTHHHWLEFASLGLLGWPAAHPLEGCVKYSEQYKIWYIFYIINRNPQIVSPPATMYMLSPSVPSLMTASPVLILETTKRSTIMAICSSSRRLRKSFFWMDLTIRFVSLEMEDERGRIDLRSVKAVPMQQVNIV